MTDLQFLLLLVVPIGALVLGAGMLWFTQPR